MPTVYRKFTKGSICARSRNAVLRWFSSNSSKRQKNSKQAKKDFDYCVDLVQNRDRESYLCGLLMPSSSRRSFFAIRAFNVELASVKDQSVNRPENESGSSLALKIRMQWWKDALSQIYEPSEIRRHENSSVSSEEDVLISMATSCWNNPIVRVLDDAVHESNLTRRFLERLLEAREIDLANGQLETINDAIVYSENVFSSLLYLTLECTGVREEAADIVAYHAGIGIGLVTALRALPIRLARGECSIPSELLPESLFPFNKFLTLEDPKTELSESEQKLLSDAIQHVAHIAASHLSQARETQSNVPKEARSCFLPVVPALHYLSELEKAQYDVLDPNLLELNRLMILALLSRTWLTGVY